MNCNTLSRLLEEIPMPLWTDAQRVSAHEHCRTCEGCQTQIAEEAALFAQFDEMQLPEPQAGFKRPVEDGLHPSDAPSGGRSRLSSNSVILSWAAALFLCIGSAYQLFMEGGFVPNWFAPKWFTDGGRLESVMTLLYNSPTLSVALVLVGLVFCLTRDPHSYRD